ncbi:MAG: CbiX/SirB N-terminal domain-containing protein [Sneathiella sp.]|uniref:CbiX/SirB N-terminal domain-containing protein n=1 Tax=Sneathiella sp. TaxID=1964365 RepID=UPI003001F2EE
MIPTRPSVLIIAHGSSVSKEAHEAAEQHAATLRQSNRYGTVGVCFLTEADLMPNLPDGEVFLLPFFMSNGFFVQKKIPSLFKLVDGRRAEQNNVILQCDALGLDPELSGIIINMGLEACEHMLENPEDIHLVLVAHGSEKSKASADATYHQQKAVEKRSIFGDVTSVFLNEQPELGQWLISHSDDVRPKILIGLFAAEGPHATEDVPAGIHRATEAIPEPLTIWYAGIVGTRPEIVKLVQDSITRCAAADRL